MPRIRSVHPDLCEDETLVHASDSAERTFVRLWTYLDDDGRTEDRPKLLAARLFPEHDDKTEETIDTDLTELQSLGLVIRYEVGGKHYLSAKPESWRKYQKPRHPSPSKYPAPPEDDDKATADDSKDTAERREPHAVVGVGGGEGDGGTALLSPSPSAQDDTLTRFDSFWAQYPRHPRTGKPGAGASKHKALQLWKHKLKPAERAACLVAVENYAASQGIPDAPFPAYATTWLNEHRWEDWMTPAQPRSDNGKAESVPDYVNVTGT